MNDTTTKNRIAGHGLYSHEVPSQIGAVVLIRDGQHNGTEVYAVEEGFRFVSLDSGGDVATTDRCVLVRLTGVSVDDLSEPYGCDLDTPDGLALIGLDADEPADDLGEILWDSTETDEEAAITALGDGTRAD